MKTKLALALLAATAVLRSSTALADDVRFSFSFGIGAPAPMGFYISNVPVRPLAPCAPVAVVAPVCAPAPVMYVPVARPLPVCPPRPFAAVAPVYGYRPYHAPVIVSHRGGRGHRGHGHAAAYATAPVYYGR